MRLISWNCGGGFQNKMDCLPQSDVYIIQECDNPDTHEYFPNYNHAWIEHSSHKGLGVFIKDDIKFKVIESDDYGLKCYLPFEIQDHKILAVWACENYIEDMYVYLRSHNLLLHNSTVVCGDFNSNSRWDGKHGIRNHSNVVSMLESNGMFSAYHYKSGLAHGMETENTFYKNGKGYHIDYIFAKRENIGDFVIIPSTKSDHSILMCDII